MNARFTLAAVLTTSLAASTMLPAGAQLAQSNRLQPQDARTLRREALGFGSFGGSVNRRGYQPATNPFGGTGVRLGTPSPTLRPAAGQGGTVANPPSQGTHYGPVPTQRVGADVTYRRVPAETAHPVIGRTFGVPFGELLPCGHRFGSVWMEFGVEKARCLHGHVYRRTGFGAWVPSR